MNLKQLIDEVIEDWFYLHPHGFADEPYNIQDLRVLRETLQSKKYPTQVIEETIEFLTEKAKHLVKNKESGRVYAVQNINPDIHDVLKKNASPEDIEAASKGSKSTSKQNDDTPEKDAPKDVEVKRSSTGVHGNLEDGDNQDKHDVLEHGYKGSKAYYKKNKIKDPYTGEIKKPAPGSAGSAFNEIVSGEGMHILDNNPDMSEEELADKMYNEFGKTALGQEQSYSGQVKDDIPARFWEARNKAKGSGTIDNPENPEAFKLAERQIATYSKCLIVARAAKDKHSISQERISNLQESGNFGTPKNTQTFYGTAKSLAAQKKAVANAKKVIMPDGTTLRKEDVELLIQESGKTLNPSDTATFVMDENGTLLIQFHSDKTDPSDPQGSKTLSNDMADLEKRIDANTTLSPEKKAAAQKVVENHNSQMIAIETTYNDQTAAIAGSLENYDLDEQVEVLEAEMKKNKKNYLDQALLDSKGQLKPKYQAHIPEGADPQNMSNKEKIQAIRSFIKTPTPDDAKFADGKKADDLKVISKIAEKLSKKMGKDAPDDINIKKVLAKRRNQVVDIHRDRKNKLNQVDSGPPPLGDLEEAQEVTEGFHLDILDDNKYDANEPDQKKRLKAIMSNAFDIHMGGTVANRDTLRAALGVNSLQEFKDKFRVKEEEKLTYGPGGEKGGIVTGKVVFTYVIAEEGGEPIELGRKTYRSSDGPTGTTRTIIQYAQAMQARIKAAQSVRSDK
jgi:hypothetical protein